MSPTRQSVQPSTWGSSWSDRHDSLRSTTRSYATAPHGLRPRTHETRRVTLPVDTFIARFLEHVLPPGLHQDPVLWTPESDRPPGACARRWAELIEKLDEIVVVRDHHIDRRAGGVKDRRIIRLVQPQ